MSDSFRKESASTTGATNTPSGMHTPTRRSADADNITHASPYNSRFNPFATPYGSLPASQRGSSSNLASSQMPRQQWFHSRRVKKGSIERPWLGRKDPKEKWVTIIPLIGIFLGLAVSGVLIWEGIRTVTKHNYCEVLVDDFSSGFNTDVWTKEVEVGGYG